MSPAESLAKFTSNLRRLPAVLAEQIARKAAPVVTALARATFDAGENTYGLPWAPKADGTRATLVKTGALKRFIRYVAIGSKLRVVLGVPYAKYQVGKRPVFPTQGGTLPPVYVQALQSLADEAARGELQK